jgi:hypothetical protein
MKNWYTKIQSWYLKVKDNWVFFVICLFLTFLLPSLLQNLKNPLLNLLSYKIPIWSLLTSILLTWILYKIYKNIRNKGSLEILKATYGFGSTIIDITANLKKAVIDNKLKIVLSNNIAGDPIIGKVKRGVIEYKIGRRKITKEYIEGDIIDVP